MAGATALFSDGLDLLAEFLASSHSVEHGIAATYDHPMRWHATAVELARWSGSGDTIVLDQAALRITMPPVLWNQLYGQALHAGRRVAADGAGIATRGAGGMLAELSRLPAMADALQSVTAPAFPEGADAEPWLLLPWAPLKALLLRDRLLVQEAMRPRPLLDTLPASVADFTAAARRHGLLLQQEGRPLQLFCPRDWSERMGGELQRHFTEGVLLLFRLMFYSKDQGWGWDADSAQCAGLAALMDDAERSGLASFGGFRDSCALLANQVDGGTAGPSRDILMATAVRQLAALWPAAYLQADHPSCRLMAGWMAQVHPDASIAPDALLGPGVVVGRDCVIGAGAVLQNGAEIVAMQVVPPGIVIAAGAKATRITLSGNALLPAGTVLRGSLVLYRKASAGKQVTLGANVEIGYGVHIPDGVRVAAGASVHLLQLANGVQLPAGTVIEGSLRAEEDVEFGSAIRIGDNVLIRRGATIGDGVCLPSGIVVAAGACVQHCILKKGARLGPDVLLHGDLALGPRALVGAGVRLGSNAVIGADVMVPAGVIVQAGAHIALLELHGCWLPPGTVLGGNLRLGRHCRVGTGVVFEGDNHIGSHTELPDGLRIARGARIQRLHLSGATVPPGTVVSGDAYVVPGTRIGRGVTLEPGVVVTAAAVPDGVTVMRKSFVSRCEVKGALIQRGTRIGGDLYLAPGVRVGVKVRLHKGVRINCLCRIPDGVEIMPASIVGRFLLGPGVVLPPGTRIGGNLCLEEGVVVGKGVRFGAGVVVRAGVTIPDGARLRRGAEVRRLEIAADASLPDCYTLCGDAVVGAGASIGDRVVLGANVEVGPGVMLPPGVLLIDGARIAALRIADDVVLPAGTRLGGDLLLRRGVQVGQDVGLGSGADIGPHVVLPDGIVVLPGSRVRMLNVAAGVLPGRDVCIAGNLTAGAGARVAPGARLGAGTVLGNGCSIGGDIVLPAGLIVDSDAVLDCLDIATGVILPPQTRIGGDLRIAAGARIGERVRFGAGVEVGAGAVIGHHAVLGDEVVVGAGAVIGDHACVDSGAVVDAGVHIGHGELVHCGPPPADADISCWQAYLSGDAAPDEAPWQPDAGAAPALPAPSPPIDILPPAVLRPRSGNVMLPRPYT